MSAAPLLLGIDAGTSNVKAVLATPAGEVCGAGESPIAVSHPRAAWAEQDPEDWWAGAVAATRQAVTRAGVAPSQVAALAVSGQGCAVALVDRRGRPVRPAILAIDHRSEPQAQRLRLQHADAIYAAGGKTPAPYNADPVLMWLGEHEPEALAAATVSLTTTGFLNLRLTGRPVTNRSDASILFAYDLDAGGWSDELIEGMGIPRRLYPDLADPWEPIGGLTDAAAADLGLGAGTPVMAGGEDTSSAGLAAGAVHGGDAFLSLGTAGTAYGVHDAPERRHGLLAFGHVVPGRWLLGGSTAAVGGALAWCRDLLLGAGGLETLEQLAATAGPGTADLFFLPYLSGELQPINDGNARGAFIGMSRTTGRAELARAVFEGTAFALAHNLLLADPDPDPARELCAVGGPSASDLWCQGMADAVGRPIVALEAAAGAPLGDALLAAEGAGLATATASRPRPVRRTFEPDASIRERQAARLTLYRELYPALRAHFAAAAGLPLIPDSDHAPERSS